MDTLLKGKPGTDPDPGQDPNRESARNKGSDAASTGIVESSVNPSTGTIDQHQIREPTLADTAPTRILVRQIDMVPGAAGGPFVFVGPDQGWPYSQDRLDQILSGLRRGQYSPRPPVAQYVRPLDVNCSESTLFIFRLSDNLNWRFAAKARGITLGFFQVPAERDNYFKCRHVLNDSDGSEGSKDPFDHPDMCKIVYFIAKKTSNYFAHAFNLNVEIVYPDNPLGTPNTLPFTIDPDIRHPGGSGE